MFDGEVGALSCS